MSRKIQSLQKASGQLKNSLKEFESLPGESIPQKLGPFHVKLEAFEKNLREFEADSKNELVDANKERNARRLAEFKEDKEEIQKELAKLKERINSNHSSKASYHGMGSQTHGFSAADSPYGANTVSSRRGAGGHPAASPSGPTSYGAAPLPPGTPDQFTNPSSNAYDTSRTQLFGGYQPGSRSAQAGGNAGGASAYPGTNYGASTQDQMWGQNAALQRIDEKINEFLPFAGEIRGEVLNSKDSLLRMVEKNKTVNDSLAIAGGFISKVVKESRKQKAIFWVSAACFFAFCWLVLHFLG